MATHNAIAQVGQAVLGLLSTAAPRPEFAGAQFELYQAKDFKSPMDLGVSLYLHRITPAADVRNMHQRVDRTGKRFHPSFPIDLHYLMIAWAGDSVMQQRLLGWAIRELENSPILDSGLLNQHGPEHDTFGAEESVTMVFESISIIDMGAIWEVARHHMQPAATYVARAVRIDSKVEEIVAAPVQTRVFGSGKLVTTP